MKLSHLQVAAVLHAEAVLHDMLHMHLQPSTQPTSALEWNWDHSYFHTLRTEIEPIKLEKSRIRQNVSYDDIEAVSKRAVHVHPPLTCISLLLWLLNCVFQLVDVVGGVGGTCSWKAAEAFFLNFAHSNKLNLYEDELVQPIQKYQGWCRHML